MSGSCSLGLLQGKNRVLTQHLAVSREGREPLECVQEHRQKTVVLEEQLHARGQGSAKSSVKEQIPHILGFMGHRVTTSQSCHLRAKAAKDNI